MCIGGGPSLTRDDVHAVRGLARVIAINDAYVLAPWADVLYACDKKWWDWHKNVPDFQGMKFSLEAAQTVSDPSIQILKNTGSLGFDPNPNALRTGLNSGYQALHLAVGRFGATRILLLGYDMGCDGTKSHWFGEHPDKQPSPYPQMRAAFEHLVEPFAALSVTVINCSRRTALTTFSRAPFEDELARLQERAA